MGIKKKAQINGEHIKEYLLDFGFWIFNLKGVIKGEEINEIFKG